MDKETLEYIRYARETIEHFTGLTLKTSELLRIRQIVEEEVAKNQTTISGICKTIPYVEATYRFLWEFYGIDETLPGRIDLLLDIDHKNLESSEAVKEWFRRQQDKMFLP